MGILKVILPEKNKDYLVCFEFKQLKKETLPLIEAILNFRITSRYIIYNFNRQYMIRARIKYYLNNQTKQAKTYFFYDYIIIVIFVT